MAAKQFTGGWRKRPKDATPSKALELQKAGLTLREIGRAWNISASQVLNLIRKAKKEM